MSKPKVVSFVIVSVVLTAVAFIATHRSIIAAPPDNSMSGGVPDAIRALQTKVAALEAKPAGANFEAGIQSVTIPPRTVTINFTKTFSKPPKIFLGHKSGQSVFSVAGEVNSTTTGFSITFSGPPSFTTEFFWLAME